MKKQSFISKQNFIKELTVTQHIVLGLNVVLSLSFFIVQLAGLKAYSDGTTGLSFVSTVISIFAVMAGAKKRIICPLLGIIASILLVFINGHIQNYLMMVMYVLNIGMQIGSLIVGIKGSKDKISIDPKHARGGVCIIYLVILIGFIVFFAGMDGQSGGQQFGTFGLKDVQKITLAEQIFDACALVFMVGTLYPQLKKYDQVGYVYILNDVSMLTQGILKAVKAGQLNNNVDLFTAITMAVSTICMTAVCILGLIEGQKSIKKQKTKK